jgi:hypothetical protein
LKKIITRWIIVPSRQEGGVAAAFRTILYQHSGRQTISHNRWQNTKAAQPTTAVDDV